MNDEEEPAMEKRLSAGTRALAFCCTVCPFCILKRKWPRSTYARVMNSIERCCPFCRSYAKVRAHAPPPADQSGEGTGTP